MFVEAFPQALALSGREVWVCHNTIGELGVSSFSGRSVPSVEYIFLHTREDNRSFRLLSFPS